MKKIILSALAIAAAGTAAQADITVNVSPTVPVNDYQVEMMYVADMLKPRMERPEPKVQNLKVQDGKFTIKTDIAGAARFNIPTDDRQYISVYTVPGEDLTIDLTSLAPLTYTAKGSKMMQDIADLDTDASKILYQYQLMVEAGEPDPAEVEKLQADFDNVWIDFVKKNPESPAVAYAMLQIDGENFMNAYNGMTAEAKQSPLMPLVESQKARAEKSIAMQKRKAELESGSFVAPDFSFATVDGNDVSLSSLRGKWVIIDFWGSWCRWCIKGFPHLKEVYAQYQPELEVLGVACNDTRDAWEKALVKYELPWVNVYNPESGGGKLLEEYAVEGFPTKVIVDPEGVIKNITVGDDPSFYEILANLLKK